MRELDRGEDFIITRNGKPVGELRPFRDRYFVSTAALQAAMAGAPQIDYKELREDIDAYVDQDPTPRFWRDP
jgi:antitoxin (DNA-binding transcriptional repressor) of toxin-antitoxin stability system